MKEMKKKLILRVIFFAIGITFFSWYQVKGKEFDKVFEISPDCQVTVTVGELFEPQTEYVLDAEQIDMLRTLILKSTFTRTTPGVEYYPMGTLNYDIVILWNDGNGYLNFGTTGNYWIVTKQFDRLKIRNPQFENTLQEIIALSKVKKLVPF